MSKRGSSIDVPESWLEQCRGWRQEQGLSLEETGAALARAVRRVRAFGTSTVHRYLTGRVVTDELTQAFAKAMKVPYPIQVLDSPRHQQWCDLGVRLDEADAEAFEAELKRLQHLVDMAETIRDMRKK